VKPKAKKKKQHHKKVAVTTPRVTTTAPTPAVVTTVGASSGITLNPTGGGNGPKFLIIVVTLACAIACLGASAVPARRLPWRSAAVFVSDRQVELFVGGLALLAAAAMTLILSSGF
jgi:hypothetical protein